MNENLEHGPTENRILDVNCETHVEGIDPRAGELARATKIALTRVYAPWNPRVCVFFFFFSTRMQDTPDLDASFRERGSGFTLS